MNANTGKTVLGGLLPLISNPATLALVGIGAAGIIIARLLSDEDEDTDNASNHTSNGSERLQSRTTNLTAQDSKTTATEPFGTVNATAEEAVSTADVEPNLTKVFDDIKDEPQQEETVNEEDAKKEVIRQAMSELGKRSAAARAKKRTVHKSLHALGALPIGALAPRA